MKRSRILIGFLLLLAICIIPFILPANSLSDWSYILQGIGALASLATFILAIILFNQYGIERSIIQRQTDIVLTLLEKLRTEYFYMELIQDKTASVLFSPVKGLDHIMDQVAGCEDYPVLFGMSYSQKLEDVQKIIDGLYTPKEIVAAFKHLELRSIETPRMDIFDKYIYIMGKPLPELMELYRESYDKYFKQSMKIQKRKRNADYYDDWRERQEAEKELADKMIYYENPGLLNGEMISLKEYGLKWQEFIDSLKSWLQKNSNLHLDLNL